MGADPSPAHLRHLVARPELPARTFRERLRKPCAEAAKVIHGDNGSVEAVDKALRPESLLYDGSESLQHRGPSTHSQQTLDRLA